jgi:hypothetical protein
VIPFSSTAIESSMLGAFRRHRMMLHVTMSDTAITVQETLEQIRDVIQTGS